MKNQVVIGIDVSKETLDFVVLLTGKNLFHMQVSNNNKGIKEFYKEVSQQVDLDVKEWLFCLEHTGVYCNPMLEYASKKGLYIWMEADAARTLEKSKLFMDLRGEKLIS